MASALVRLLEGGDYPFARLAGVYRSNTVETLLFDVDVERPQRPAADIHRVEKIAATFIDDRLPIVSAVRDGFPTESLHLNLSPPGEPPQLCLDERPWVEVRPRWTAFAFLERIRWWLSATARGDLHGEAQPPEPMFVTSTSVIVPNEVFTEDWNEQRKLIIRSVNTLSHPNTIVVSEPDAAHQSMRGIHPFLLAAQPQQMQRLKHAPENIAQLGETLRPWGIDLVELLKSELLRIIEEESAILDYRLLILVHVPLMAPGQQAATHGDLKAFLTLGSTLGDLGVELGIFYPPDIAAGGKFTRRIPADTSKDGAAISAFTLSVHRAFDRDVAAAGAGYSPDKRSVTLVGGGSIGSHVMEAMTRDGFGVWTVIDHDALLPHNVQRHRAGAGAVGYPKAQAAADQINWSSGTQETKWVCSNVLESSLDIDATLNTDLIVDASASLPVSRLLSDKSEPVRCASVFFNPSGSDVVLLLEDKARTVRLAALEAQYYRALINEPQLADHLRGDVKGYAYAGSCRAVSFHMPEHRVSMLSGAIAGDLHKCVSSDQAAIAIWTGKDETGLRRHIVPIREVETHILFDWEVVIDKNSIERVYALRASSLPSETGGILLGTIDMQRRQICIVDVVPAPSDSKGDVTGFERGVKNLKAVIYDAHIKTAGQVEYIGEWHSHPEGAAPNPSGTDVRQLVWLGSERSVEGLPAVMMILSDDQKYTINLVMPV